MKSSMTFHGMSNLHLISLYQISAGLILLQLSKALHPYCFISEACKVTLILISSLSCSVGFFNKDFFCLCLPWGLTTGVRQLQQAYTWDPNLIHFCISLSSVMCHCVNWQFVLGGVCAWYRISTTLLWSKHVVAFWHCFSGFPYSGLLRRQPVIINPWTVNGLAIFAPCLRGKAVSNCNCLILLSEVGKCRKENSIFLPPPPPCTHTQSRMYDFKQELIKFCSILGLCVIHSNS